jgi:hypothetical protein
MGEMPRRDAIELPLRFCSDPDVNAFCVEEAWRIGPYSVPQFTKSAHQLFQAARDQFGDYRCLDLEFFEH